ncbi:MAG TPA: C39 family peptidase [Sphingobium sp.]|uniref:C39 family peptidase n=1 Tax=Sphingobium sp. TaxID=1912891 RepID=UPI002ED1CAD3
MARVKSLRHKAGVIVAGMFLALAPAARAQMIVDAPGRAAGLNVKVKSWAEIPFRTIVRQRFDFSCGSAALATLLTYQYGLPTDETAPFKVMWDGGDQEKIRKMGFSLLDMKNYLAVRGFKAQGYHLGVADIHDLARPMIALVTIKGYTHFVVIKGAQDNKVLLGDPARGLITLPDADFEKMWGGIALIIVESPSANQPVFNAARDWERWTSPPIRTFQGERSITSITDNLPPIYQLQQQILPVIPIGATR